MKNNFIKMVMLTFVLVFGMMVISCNENNDDGITVTVTGISSEFINKWGVLTFFPSPSGGLALTYDPNGIQVKGSSLTFSMKPNGSSGSFKTPGTYNVSLEFYQEKEWSNRVASYEIKSKTIIAGSNTILFDDFELDDY